MERKTYITTPLDVCHLSVTVLIYWLVVTIILLLQHNIGANCQHYSDACKSINQQLGTCVPLQSCPLFMGWLNRRPMDKENLRTLVEFTCYFDDRNPKVCCPNDELQLHNHHQPMNDPTNSRFGMDSIPVRRGILPLKQISSSSSDKLYFPSKALPISFLSSGEDFIKRLETGAGVRSHDTPIMFPPTSGNYFKEHRRQRQDGNGRAFSNADSNVPKNLGKDPTPVSSMDLRNHPNFRLIPKMKDCSNALKLDSLIGTYGAYPWLALIGNKRRNSLDFEHVCAGAIINSRYILTAGHCFNGKGAIPKYVRLGEYDLSTLIDQGNEFLPQSRRKDFRIEKIVTHPDFKEGSSRHDIALVRVNRDIPLNSTTFIKVVCLPFVKEYGIEERLSLHESHWMKEHEGESAWVAGWSRRSWGGIYSRGSKSSVLQEGFAQFTSDSRCRQDYPSLVDSFIAAKSQICVKGKGACVLDSGGPLLYPVKVPSERVQGFAEPKFFMLGLLSHGPTGSVCHKSEEREAGEESEEFKEEIAESLTLPASVFTRVSKYLTWILNNLQE